MSDTDQRPKALFPPLSADVSRRLGSYNGLLKAVHPLPGRHRASLPRGVADLSRMLTSERSPGDVAKYMQTADGVAAYLYCFLPWNLLRQTRLLAGLSLNLQPGMVVADLGSGPLTAVQALWLARPELRDMELTVYAVDRAAKVLKTGRDLFRALTEQDGGRCPWRVEIISKGISTRLPRRANLVMAANVLNENSSGRGLDERLLSSLMSSLADGGQLLAVEPGTRTGGRLIATLREELVEEGFSPLAPCPHTAECPMPGRGGKPWCHFRFPAYGAPPWLLDLSRAARLPKTSLSLSFLHAVREPVPQDGVRVISQPFSLPGPDGGQVSARYGCSARGLVVLHGRRDDVEAVHSGRLGFPEWPEHPRVDAKSGGVMLELPPMAGADKPAPEPRQPERPPLRKPRPKPVRPAKGRKRS